MNKSAVIRRCPKSDMTDKKPKSEQKYCLYNSKGTKVLGRHPSKEKAKAQERVIQVHKRLRESI